MVWGMLYAVGQIAAMIMEFMIPMKTLSPPPYQRVYFTCSPKNSTGKVFILIAFGACQFNTTYKQLSFDIHLADDISGSVYTLYVPKPFKFRTPLLRFRP